MRVIDRFRSSLTAEARYRLLVDAVTDYAIYMLDRSGFVTTWNRGAQRLNGYKATEIVGQHYSTFHTKEDQRNGLPDLALEISRREGSFETETWRMRRDGSQFWAHVVIDPVHNAFGALIGFVEITRDLTNARNARLELDRAREALFQSRKMDAVCQLTGGVAHDFNNLLMVVLGGLELMYRRIPKDTTITPLLNNAIQAVHQGKSLVERMLAFARHQDLKPETIDLSSTVLGMMDFLRANLGSTILLEAHFPPVLAPICVDPHQLKLVLLNLAINSRDAMPDGGSIIIGAREDFVASDHSAGPGSRRHVCLFVADTGGGMDETVLSRAMEPFFTTKGVGKSPGLGLSMAYGFVEQSGGRFSLSSHPGKGTIAELSFPVAAALAEGGRETATADNSRNEATKARPQVVLAVDDDRLMLMNTTSVLNSLGHKVFTATSGQQALNLIRRETMIDLVIIDRAMPELTGVKLAETIRTEWPRLPVIFAATPVDETVRGLPRLLRRDELARAIAGAARPPPLGALT